MHPIMRTIPLWLSLSVIAAAAQYPLDPLTADEIAMAASVLKQSGHTTDSSRFPMIVLQEPPKAEVLNYRTGSAFRREAFVVVYERAANQTAEAVVDLNSRKLVSWKPVPGVQPSFMLEDYEILQDVVRKDPAWQAAIRKRGITDLEHVQLDPWSAGNFGFPEEQGIRIFRAVALYRGPGLNAYARPIEGVVAYVDMNAKRILKLADSGVTPVAKAPFEYDQKSVGKLRIAPKLLSIAQPQGASYQVNGSEVRWQKWRFRYSVHPREGLVLHTVGYEDGGRVRPILYRASLSEMVVPYGDPSPAWFFRGVFDEGEYGLGQMMFPLEPGADAPNNAVFFSATLPDAKGTARTVERAVALYERDGGILWKHLDMDSGHNESRRARDLVLSAVATVGNYDYGFNWIFHQDGTLEMDVVLTGIMQTKGVAGHQDHHSHLVMKDVAAVHHQHFFNFRLDMDVDGAAGNSVLEMNTEALPAGPGNPFHNAFTMREQPLRREMEAQRQCSLAASRKWKIVHAGVTNALGQAVGYMLVPGENSVPYAAANSAVRKRAGFLNAHLWVTPYDATETNAAGYYINQSKGGEGLPKWTEANRPVENQDIVLWYTMGITHIPRPEEWPVMTPHHAGFKLAPAGFFSSNPALDVPATPY
jgi:primary-amine oxidase